MRYFSLLFFCISLFGVLSPYSHAEEKAKSSEATVVRELAKTLHELPHTLMRWTNDPAFARLSENYKEESLALITKALLKVDPQERESVVTEIHSFLKGRFNPIDIEALPYLIEEAAKIEPKDRRKVFKSLEGFKFRDDFHAVDTNLIRIVSQVKAEERVDVLSHVGKISSGKIDISSGELIFSVAKIDSQHRAATIQRVKSFFHGKKGSYDPLKYGAYAQLLSLLSEVPRKEQSDLLYAAQVLGIHGENNVQGAFEALLMVPHAERKAFAKSLSTFKAGHYHFETYGRLLEIFAKLDSPKRAKVVKYAKVFKLQERHPFHIILALASAEVDDLSKIVEPTKKFITPETPEGEIARILSAFDHMDQDRRKVIVEYVASYLPATTYRRSVSADLLTLLGDTDEKELPALISELKELTAPQTGEMARVYLLQSLKGMEKDQRQIMTTLIKTVLGDISKKQAYFVFDAVQRIMPEKREKVVAAAKLKMQGAASSRQIADMIQNHTDEADLIPPVVEATGDSTVDKISELLTSLFTADEDGEVQAEDRELRAKMKAEAEARFKAQLSAEKKEILSKLSLRQRKILQKILDSFPDLKTENLKNLTVLYEISVALSELDVSEKDLENVMEASAPYLTSDVPSHSKALSYATLLQVPESDRKMILKAANDIATPTMKKDGYDLLVQALTWKNEKNVIEKMIMPHRELFISPDMNGREFLSLAQEGIGVRESAYSKVIEVLPKALQDLGMQKKDARFLLEPLSEMKNIEYEKLILFSGDLLFPWFESANRGLLFAELCKLPVHKREIVMKKLKTRPLEEMDASKLIWELRGISSKL